MRRLWLWIRNSHAMANRQYGNEHGQMQVLQAILDEYGEMKRIPKRVRRAMVAMGDWG